jgi:hypothetical protein
MSSFRVSLSTCSGLVSTIHPASNLPILLLDLIHPPSHPLCLKNDSMTLGTSLGSSLLLCPPSLLDWSFPEDENSNSKARDGELSLPAGVISTGKSS